MSVLKMFDPPSNWTRELSPVQLAASSAFISNTVDEEISQLKGADRSFKPQFFNATKIDQVESVTDTIPWQGFPKVLERQCGGFTEAALRAAEPVSLPEEINPYYLPMVRFRPQDEY